MAITESIAAITVLSPPIHSACASLVMSELIASATPDVLSTFASSSVIPMPDVTVRAFSTNTSEFDSAGFQATPTRWRLGSMRRAS